MKKYYTPDCEVVWFITNDVICTSETKESTNNIVTDNDNLKDN